MMGIIHKSVFSWLLIAAASLAPAAQAQGPQSDSPASTGDSFEKARQTLLKMTGCYLVDYNYYETTGLQEGYKLDSRGYDANRNISVKELVYPIEISPRHIRLQHILFMTDKKGVADPRAFLRHQAEDWEYEPGHLYDFVAPLKWEVRKLPEASGAWVRKITNLDDGLRYQCSAQWDFANEYPEWRCDNFAPIPGRETRDMGRKDYNTLARSTRIIHYGTNWLERQDNVKTIFQNGEKIPLAKEVGKNWYAKLADSECDPVRSWVEKRQPYWEILRQTWTEYLNGEGAFNEKPPVGGVPRFVKMMEIEDKYIEGTQAGISEPETYKEMIRQVIEAYRAR